MMTPDIADVALSSAAALPFVGREKIAAGLQNFLLGANRTRPGVAFISGIPGAGKSTLARHAFDCVLDASDWLFSFKYDQFNTAAPAAFFVRALEEMTQEMEAMAPRAREELRRLLIDAVSPNAQLLVSLCPSLGDVLGPQPELIPLAPRENQIRLSFVLRKAIAVMTRRFRRAVLFLDDLQWADAATLTVLTDLVGDTTMGNLTVLCCYRSAVADNATPLRRTIRMAGNPLFDEEVGSFDESDIAELLAQRLNLPPEDALTLSAEIRRSTDATPMAAMNVLELLADEAQGADDHLDLKSAMRAVATMGAQPDGYDLAGKRLSRLDEAAQDLLTISAYIGERIDVPLLMGLTGQTDTQLRARLDILVEQGVVDENKGVYTFAHDTFQRAAYDRDTPLRAHRADLKRSAAQTFEQRYRAGQDTGWLFRSVSLFNEDLGSIGQEEERARIADLNRKATRAALDSGDAARALEFANAGLSITPLDAWRRAPEEMMAAHLDAAEAAYLTNDIARFDALIDTAADHARDSVEWAGAYLLRLQQKVSTVQYEEALDIAIGMLDELGGALPRRASKAQVGISFARTMMLLRGRSMDDLFALPKMSDVRAEKELETLMLAASAAYFAEPNLFALIVFRMVRLSVEKGNSRLSAFGWVCYGLAQCAVVGNVKAGYEYGTLSLRLVEEFKADDLRARVHMLFNTFVRHWSESRDAVADHLYEGERAGQASGDLEFATYCGWHRCCDQFLSGAPVPEVEEALAKVLALGREYNQHKVAFLLAMVQDFLGWLKAPEGAVPDDAAQEAFCERHKDYTSLCYVKMFQGMRHLMAGDAEAALSALQAIDAHFDSLQGQFYVPYYQMLRGLAAAHVNTLRPGAAMRRSVRVSQRKLKAWAARGATDIEPLAEIMAAATAWADGRDGAAIAGFDAVIQNARDGRSPLWVGVLAAQALERLYQRIGSAGQARWAAEQARELGALWGVTLTDGAEPAAAQKAAAPASMPWRAGHGDRESWMQDVCLRVLDVSGATLLRITKGSGGDRVCLLSAQRQANGSVALDLTGEMPQAVDPAREIALVQPDDMSVFVCLSPVTEAKTPAAGDAEIEGLLTPLLSELRRDATARALRQVEDQRVALQTAYGRFIPGYLLKTLGHSEIVDIRVGDFASDRMTVMFCDMRGATGIMEKIGAKASMELFNELFIAIESEVLGAGGYIDNFLGDAVLALFNAPAETCLEAAVGVARALEKIQPEIVAKGLPAPGFGIGLSCGEVVVGAVGGLNQIRMGAIGDTLNLAARLESLTKRYGTAVLISEDMVGGDPGGTARQLRQVDHVTVVGRKTPVRLYEVIDALPQDRAARVMTHLPQYDAALQAYYTADFAQACAALDRFLDGVPEDVPATRLRARADHFRQNDPGPGWSAIHALKEK
ncbi:hypothetical protein E4Z66_08805 [Aliishimia ponticola]|uniref:Guanylate cyclase domain-containing protein n=1 Tax=Aliishimia ponticola TaxID=2499833 RepID=A0A4S4NFV9_9RHOB|nr:AAA family ATPase [Aliishimia ponticola]THH37028.1 hypothetical protein E4Z66_08805 [Aliishimia ponticola]